MEHTNDGKVDNLRGAFRKVLECILLKVHYGFIYIYFFLKKKKKLSCGSYCKEQSVGKDRKKKKKKRSKLVFHFSFLEFF